MRQSSCKHATSCMLLWCHVTPGVNQPDHGVNRAVCVCSHSQGGAWFHSELGVQGLWSCDRWSVRACVCRVCSGDSCSPKVRLRASPGSLTVHLYITNHSLGQEYGDHAQHRVSYGKEGEPLKVSPQILRARAGPDRVPDFDTSSFQ